MSEIPQDLLNNFGPPNFPDSYFFSFEGIEGAGKSTQLNSTKEYLESLGYNVIILREPGGTAFGEKLREAILNSDSPLHPIAEAHLFAASRAQILFEKVLKYLETPKTVVICDRFLDSSLAYQGHARQLTNKTILELHNNFPLTTVPHLTFYIRISLETSLERQRIRNNDKDYFESEKNEFHKTLIEGYDNAAKVFPNRIAIINGEGDVKDVQSSIRERIDLLLK